MHRAKKPKNKNITLTESKIEKIKTEVTKSAVSKASLLMMMAARDELNLDDEQICAVMIRMDRYAVYVDDKIVKLKDIQAMIEKNTGLKLEGRS